MPLASIGSLSLFKCGELCLLASALYFNTKVQLFFKITNESSKNIIVPYAIINNITNQIIIFILSKQ